MTRHLHPKKINLARSFPTVSLQARDRLPGTMEVSRHFSATSQSEDEDFSVEVTSSGWDAWKPVPCARQYGSLSKGGLCGQR